MKHITHDWIKETSRGLWFRRSFLGWCFFSVPVKKTYWRSDALKRQEETQQFTKVESVFLENKWSGFFFFFGDFMKTQEFLFSFAIFHSGMFNVINSGDTDVIAGLLNFGNQSSYMTQLQRSSQQCHESLSLCADFFKGIYRWGSEKSGQTKWLKRCCTNLFLRKNKAVGLNPATWPSLGGKSVWTHSKSSFYRRILIWRLEVNCGFFLL